MNKSLAVSIVLAGLMASTAAITQAVAPTKRMADQRAKFDLATRVPAAFGDWRIDPQVVPLQVDADTQARLDKLYNQTLSRTYINSRGERVMLSIAYGGDQSDNMGVHKPEVCYVAQGFNISDLHVADMAIQFGTLPVKQMVASAGSRVEPITYWINVGNAVRRPGFSQRLEEIRIGLTGTVPDGMLVRVSNIDSNSAGSYRLHAAFVRELVGAMPAQDRARLIGVFPG
jgi:EpsI family protein